jgi:hypothetical protein
MPNGSKDPQARCFYKGLGAGALCFERLLNHSHSMLAGGLVEMS